MTDIEPSARWQRALRRVERGETAAAISELKALVEQNPHQPPAWLLLAQLARGAQHCRAAVAYARNAAVAMRGFREPRLLAEIALELQALGETPIAIQLIRSLDPTGPGVLAVADRLAQCLGQADFHAEALSFLDTALGHTTPTPGFSFIRATTLRHLGRKQDATAEYLRCLELAPGYGAAMLMLAQHNATHDPDTQITRIRQALQSAPRQDDLNKAMLHYALFIHLDAAGDTSAAWKSLMQGASIKRRLLAWHPKRDIERVAAIRKLCNGAFFDGSSSIDTDNTRRPIFIVGQPRTGTTVLERILGNHSQVASAGELNDFHLALCWQADVLVEHVDPVLLRACAGLDFAAVGHAYRQRTAWRKKNKSFLIDKLPENFWYSGVIHKALPEARIVCLLRDPMDTCFSNLKELFAGSAYPYSYDPLEAAEHHLHFRQMLQYWDKVMPGVVLTVRYEELVRDTASVARRVMEHCGLPFEPSCVDLLRNTAPSATASSSQVREPVHTRSIGAWRRYAEPMAEAHAWLEARLPREDFAACVSGAG